MKIRSRMKLKYKMSDFVKKNQDVSFNYQRGITFNSIVPNKFIRCLFFYCFAIYS